MAKPNPTPPRASTLHRQVPAAWVDALRAAWTQVTETEVEVRIAPRGSWYKLPGTRCAVAHLDGADDTVEQEHALGHAQSAYDAAWRWRDEQDKRCDARLLGYRRTGDGYVQVFEEGRGGRMSEEDVEDVPDERHQFSPVAVWRVATEERETLVKQVERLADKVVALADAASTAALKHGESRSGEYEARAAEAFATAQAYRAERGFETVERVLERYEPVIRDYAATRKAETLLRQARPATGDPVVDAWRRLVDLTDLPTAAMLRQRCGATGASIVAAMERSDISRDDIITGWGAWRAGLAEQWQELLAACPGGVRETLVALAVAVKAAEQASPGPATPP